jgi:hypothetical protein
MSKRTKRANPAPTQHEYIRRLLEIQSARGGNFPVMPGKSGHVEATVAHERKCAIFKGGACNCDCDITFKSVYQLRS